MLEIENLSVKIEDKLILKNLNLSIKSGEVHAIMGPNGSGKSTLSKVIAGHPDYEVVSGTIEYEINFKKKNLLELTPEERAREGVFLAFQYPIEISGVNNSVFLRTAFNEICKHQGISEMDPLEFDEFLRKKMKTLDIDPVFVNRPLNVGYSGGEKKRNEMLQMAVLSPRLSFLDETDSGLDIDSMKIVADCVNNLRSKTNAFVVVTHYQRLLNLIVPDYVHVLADGVIIESGDKNLAIKVEEKGYEWLLQREGIAK